MVVISKAVLIEFAEKYPDTEAALMKCYNETQAADWRNFGTHKEYDKIDASKVQFKK